MCPVCAKKHLCLLLTQSHDDGRGLVGLRAPAHRHLRERRARDQDGVRRVAEDSQFRRRCDLAPDRAGDGALRRDHSYR